MFFKNPLLEELRWSTKEGWCRGGCRARGTECGRGESGEGKNYKESAKFPGHHRAKKIQTTQKGSQKNKAGKSATHSKLGESLSQAGGAQGGDSANPEETELEGLSFVSIPTGSNNGPQEGQRPQ